MFGFWVLTNYGDFVNNFWMLVDNGGGLDAIGLIYISYAMTAAGF